MSEREIILVVDDEPLNVKLLKAHLSAAGYLVWGAANGEEALAMAEQQPDLIVLDIMMPGMDGLEVCRRLKESESVRDIPVVFLSALQDSEIKVRGLRQGGVDYVEKPFDSAELLARVRTHLTIRRQERELSDYARKLELMVEERTRQLIHADRLATIGTFAAAIIHEINSPLNFIGLSAEFLMPFWDAAKPILEKHAAEDESEEVGKRTPRVGKYIGNILEGQRRIAEILNTLRKYAKNDNDIKSPELLEDAVQDAVRLLQHRFKGRVGIEISIPPGTRILCDRQRMGQVFINLFNNAIDAMAEERGVITVRAVPGVDSVEISVRDSGRGIPEEFAGTIFDPFFTTKGERNGTGLGLYIVRNIIEEHGGEISLSDHEGQGAEFLVALPLAREARVNAGPGRD